MTPRIKIQMKPTTAGVPRYTGLWEGRDGSWRSAGTFGARRTAEDAARDAWRAGQRREYVDPRTGAVLLRTRVKEVYLPSVAHLAPTTINGYRSILDNWVLPYLGDRAVGEITTDDVEAWVAKMSASPRINANTVRHAHKMLYTIMRGCLRARLITFNPAEGTPNLPHVAETEVRVMTPEDIDRYLDALPPQHRDFVTVMLETGIRFGEALALSPQQIVGQVVTIDRALVEVRPEQTPDGSCWLRKAPKGKKTRTVLVDPSLVLLLQRAARARRLAPDSDRPIFVNPRTGLPWRRSTWNNIVRRAMKDAGLDFRTKHLRSSHASWLLAGGVDIALVKQRLGHHSVTVTERYLRPLPEAETASLASFRKIRDRSRVTD